MPRACVANQDFLCSHGMIATSVSGTGVNGVTVVDAAADRVTFDNSDTHVGVLAAIAVWLVVCQLKWQAEAKCTIKL